MLDYLTVARCSATWKKYSLLPIAKLVRFEIIFRIRISLLTIRITGRKNKNNAYIDNFLDTATEESLNKYTYIVKKVYYTKTALASILRMFNGCLPLGCSYETEVEDVYAKVLVEEIEKEKHKEKGLNGSTTN